MNVSISPTATTLNNSLSNEYISGRLSQPESEDHNVTSSAEATKTRKSSDEFSSYLSLIGVHGYSSRRQVATALRSMVINKSSGNKSDDDVFDVKQHDITVTDDSSQVKELDESSVTLNDGNTTSTAQITDIVVNENNITTAVEETVEETAMNLKQQHNTENIVDQNDVFDEHDPSSTFGDVDTDVTILPSPSDIIACDDVTAVDDDCPSSTIKQPPSTSSSVQTPACTLSQSRRSVSSDQAVCDVLRDYYTAPTDSEKVDESVKKTPAKPIISHALLPRAMRGSSMSQTVSVSTSGVDYTVPMCLLKDHLKDNPVTTTTTRPVKQTVDYSAGSTSTTETADPTSPNVETTSIGEDAEAADDTAPDTDRLDVASSKKFFESITSNSSAVDVNNTKNRSYETGQVESDVGLNKHRTISLTSNNSLESPMFSSDQPHAQQTTITNGDRLPMSEQSWAADSEVNVPSMADTKAFFESMQKPVGRSNSLLSRQKPVVFASQLDSRTLVKSPNTWQQPPAAEKSHDADTPTKLDSETKTADDVNKPQNDSDGTNMQSRSGVALKSRTSFQWRPANSASGEAPNIVVPIQPITNNTDDAAIKSVSGSKAFFESKINDVTSVKRGASMSAADSMPRRMSGSPCNKSTSVSGEATTVRGPPTVPRKRQTGEIGTSHSQETVNRKEGDTDSTTNLRHRPSLTLSGVENKSKVWKEFMSTYAAMGKQ